MSNQGFFFFDTGSHASLQQIDTMILMKMVKHSQISEHSTFALFLQYLKKEVRNEVGIFACRYTSQFPTSRFQDCCKVMQSLLMRVIKHSKSTQTNKFAISLHQYQKNIRNKVHPLHADEHQRFHQLALLFLMVAAIQIRSTQDKESINCFAIY